MLERLAGHQLDVDATVCEETDHVPCMVVHSEPDKHGAWHQAGGVVGPAELLLVPRSEGLASVRSVPTRSRLCLDVLGPVIDLEGIEEGDSRVMSCTGREAGTRAAGAALISGARAHVASGITHQNGCISGPWKQAESGVGTGGDGALPRGRVIDSSIPASTTLTSFLLRGRLQGNLPTASFRRGLADQD